MKAIFGLIAAGCVAMITALIPATTTAEEGIKVGILHCKQVPGKGVNLLIHSVSVIDCELVSPEGRERYRGEAGVGLGIDLDWTEDRAISYTVLAGAKDVKVGSHALVGKYYGARGSATVGVGVGAQVLVGGGSKNISLQPLAVETATGFGVAGGLGYLYLEAAE